MHVDLGSNLCVLLIGYLGSSFCPKWQRLACVSPGTETGDNRGVERVTAPSEMSPIVLLPLPGCRTPMFVSSSAPGLQIQGQELAVEELVSFEEVAVYFSEEEWALLDSVQRSLYWDAMQENYEAVSWLGDKESPPTVEETRPCTTKVEQSPATTARRKRRVVVVGDSLLRGTEAPICRPDSSSREVCCLPGARIRDVTEALSRIIRPSDYYPMLLIHVGTNDTARCDTERIKCDYRALGVWVKEFGAQVVFSSILPVKGRGLGRERCILEVNAWLRRWCHQEGFGFLDHGVLFQEGLLGGDGVHLSRSGKALFGHRLAKLVRRALN
ncbi:uncharacterized protein LOC142821506 [Pelodiscus sinensis]|uniref:uncharacterized protein LOC142821506 n=1 Tax=Pelodiscus sinensis TaxID=13735 RepID=UPI003F6B3B35